MVKSIRMSLGLAVQIDAIVEEEGSDQSTVLLRLIQDGLLRQSVSDLVAESTSSWRALKMDHSLVSEVLGDMDTRLKTIESMLKR